MSQSADERLERGWLARWIAGDAPGEPIASPRPPGLCVVALDLQRDFLADDARLPVPRGTVEPLLAASNRVLDEAAQHGARVVYVRNVFRRSDRIGNLVRGHAAVEASDGVALDPRVHLVSDHVFDKSTRDAFHDDAFDAWLRREQIGALVLLGVFAEACVRATALGARHRGYRVTMVRDAIAARSERSRDSVLHALDRAGAHISDAASVWQSG